VSPLQHRQYDVCKKSQQIVVCAEDEVAHINKSAMQMNKIIEEYRMVIEQSQKSNEAAAAHGGGRQWPPWVVQIICELLVNGTTPAAVPTVMQTIYQMLTGDTPDELVCQLCLELHKYSQLQPFSRPELTELIGKRIDVLCSFDINIRKGTKELRWCQGKVLEIVESAQDPTVKVKWDSQLDAHGYEEEIITNQNLNAK
jgi:hypothetical protein